MAAGVTCSSRFVARGDPRMWLRTENWSCSWASRWALYVSSHQRIRSPRVQPSGFCVSGSSPCRWRSELALRLAELQEKWRQRAGYPRRHSSAEALIVQLPAHPIVTVATAQKLLGRSKQAVNEAIAALADKGVLRAITLAKRNRAWEARELFDLINDVERELATPYDDESGAVPGHR
jgi:hypothetical protein